MYIRHADECSTMNESAPPANKMPLYSAVNSKLHSIAYSAVYSKVSSVVYSIIFCKMYNRQEKRAPEGIGQHRKPLGCLCTF